jgi:hypothetical protein
MTTMCIFFIVISLLWFMVFIMRWPLGAMEALSVTIFVGMACDYCLHIAHAFMHSEAPSQHLKVRQALTMVGNSVLGAAITTIGSCVFLMFCVIIFFKKMGIIIIINTLGECLFERNEHTSGRAHERPSTSGRQQGGVRGGSPLQPPCAPPPAPTTGTSNPSARARQQSTTCRRSKLPLTRLLAGSLFFALIFFPAMLSIGEKTKQKVGRMSMDMARGSFTQSENEGFGNSGLGPPPSPRQVSPEPSPENSRVGEGEEERSSLVAAGGNAGGMASGIRAPDEVELTDMEDKKQYSYDGGGKAGVA